MTRKVSNKGSFHFEDGKMLFWRFGPMSGQVQKNKHKRKTPERKGIWVFPYPLFDMFFAYHQLERYLPKKFRSKKENGGILNLPSSMPDFSNMDDDGNDIKKLTPEEEAQLEKEADSFHAERDRLVAEYEKRFLKVKKIWWNSELYSRIPPNKQTHREDGWYHYKNPKEFVEVARKRLIDTFESYDGKPTVASCFPNTGIKTFNWTSLSCDHFECFLPET